MDLIDHLNAIATRAQKYASKLTTEEATKMTLIVPLIKALGYDAYDPDEVEPEYTADVGTKKGEKVDYAIKRNGKVIILFECKKVGVNLDKEPASQLYRYFSVTEARVGILTDGLRYRFFSDIAEKNKMDETPFLDFDIRDVNEPIARELKKFSKGVFDIDSLVAAAEEMKYTRAIKRYLESEFRNPSAELVKLITKQVYSGQFSKSVKEKFDRIVKRSLREFINDQIDNRLVAAKQLEEREDTVDAALSGDTQLSHAEAGAELPQGVVEMSGDVVTTQEELDGFLIVRAIVSGLVAPERVVMRDTKSYCGVLLDDNNRKPICRLRFNAASKKYIGLLDEHKKETKVPIESVSEIYQQADAIRRTLQRYLEADDAVESSGP